MNDAEILKLLATLGIDEMSYRALPLLPLVAVAWADGEVQATERDLILRAAKDTWNIPAEGEMVLRNWLHYPPSAAYQKRGRSALIALCMRHGDVELDARVLTDAARLSKEVAKAAGGLWGIASINKEEANALGEITTMLEVARGTTWAESAQKELAHAGRRQRVLIKFDTDTLDLGSALGGVLVPPGSDTQISVGNGLLMGSSDACDVVAAGPTVAPSHAQLRYDNFRYYIKDLSAANQGVFVDGERVVERRLLGGERLSFGGAELDFKLLRRVPHQLTN
jgi:hypothetical protein